MEPKIVAFSVWLISHNIMFSRFIHAVACINTSSLYTTKIFHYMDMPIWFIHLSVEKHLAYFNFLATMNNAADTIIITIIIIFNLKMRTLRRWDLKTHPTHKVVNWNLNHGSLTLSIFLNTNNGSLFKYTYNPFSLSPLQLLIRTSSALFYFITVVF